MAERWVDLLTGADDEVDRGDGLLVAGLLVVLLAGGRETSRPNPENGEEKPKLNGCTEADGPFDGLTVFALAVVFAVVAGTATVDDVVSSIGMSTAGATRSWITGFFFPPPNLGVTVLDVVAGLNVVEGGAAVGSGSSSSSSSSVLSSRFRNPPVAAAGLFLLLTGGGLPKLAGVTKAPAGVEKNMPDPLAGNPGIVPRPSCNFSEPLAGRRPPSENPIKLSTGLLISPSST